MHLVRKHAIPLLVLFALTLLIEAPLIAFPFFAGERYQGINIAHFGNDEHHYISRVKEVLEGHNLGQMYLAEGKDLPDSFQSNIEQILFSPVRFLGLGEEANAATFVNIFNAIGVFLVLVLMYTLVYIMSGDVLLSLTCAVFAVGGYFLIENKTILYTIVREHRLFYTDFNIYGRSMFPYAAQIPFFAFLIFTYRAVTATFKRLSRETITPYMYVLAAGSAFGFLFYDYLYGWTFALAFCTALFLASLIFRTWSAAYASAAIGTIGLLIGSFKLAAMYELFTSPLGDQFSYFFLTIYTHAPIASMTGLAVTALFALYAYVRRDDRNNFYLFALILAGWIALEQQVLTGHAVQYGHFYWYFVVPISLLAGIYMAVRIMPHYKRLGRALCVALIALALVNTVGGQYFSFFRTVPGKLREQDFAPILQALQKEPYGVVLGDPGGESYPLLVTVYTDDDTYWVPAAITSAFSPDHLKEALLVYLYINKDVRNDPVAYLEEALASPRASAYTEMYEELEAYQSGIPLATYRITFPQTNPEILAFRKMFLPEIAREYRARMTSRQAVRDILGSGGVKYVLWDKRQYPEWDLSALSPLALIATSTDLELYLVVSSSNHSLSTTQ